MESAARYVQHRLARLLEPELPGGVILRVVLVPDLRNDRADDKQDETHPATRNFLLTVQQ